VLSASGLTVGILLARNCAETRPVGHCIGRSETVPARLASPAFGPFDAAFLPINGARFGWRKPVSDVHAVLTPEQAVAAAVVLGARLLVPIHHGVAASEDYQEVPDAEALLLAAARKRKVSVELARPGEWLTWQPRT
jgi:L-ascorbate metabolism protein UlaG (beta-lactamase superfamily)